MWPAVLHGGGRRARATEENEAEADGQLPAGASFVIRRRGMGVGFVKWDPAEAKSL